MTVHAFVDESRRQDTLAAAIIQPRLLRSARSLLRGLLFPGQRELRFKKETLPSKRLIVSTLRTLGGEVDLYSANCRLGEERARQECVTRLTHDLLGVGAMRLVLDSREGRDLRDRQTIGRVLGNAGCEAPFAYEHVASQDEPLLWIADVAAWCHGAGGDWARRIGPVSGDVVRLDRPWKARSAASRPSGRVPRSLPRATGRGVIRLAPGTPAPPPLDRVNPGERVPPPPVKLMNTQVR